MANITLNPTGTANGTLAVTGSGLTHTVTVSNITGNGSLGISIAAGTATDKAGNLAPAAASATFIVDNTAPTISISAPSASYVAGGPVTYTVTYADANFSSSSLALDNITLDPTGTANGTVAVSGSGLTYTVTVSNITGNGSLGISIAAGTATDKAGNTGPGRGQYDLHRRQHGPHDLHRRPLGILCGRRPGHLHGDLCRRQLQFQQPGLGQYHSGPDGDGQRHRRRLRFGPDPHGDRQQHYGQWFPGDFDRRRHRHRQGGQPAPAAASATFIVDNTAPTISIGAPSASYVAGGPVTYTVTYADANFSSSSLALDNITLDPTGTANGTVAVSGSGLTYTVTVSNITGNGSLGSRSPPAPPPTRPATRPRPPPVRPSSSTTRPPRSRSALPRHPTWPAGRSPTR